MCDTCGCEDEKRLIVIEQDVLKKNLECASCNRDYFSDNQILAFNLMSSPGSGKTSVLVETIKRLKPFCEIIVIEGDQQTINDAKKIQEQDVRAVQINTGKACHLEAHSISDALSRMHIHKNTILFIENVGNLVCPASFDLGERYKIVTLSVTEGDDKPLKYPYMFSKADVILINKIDLLPYVDFDVDKCISYARKVNPTVQVFKLSAKTNKGFDDWCDWIKNSNSIE